MRNIYLHTMDTILLAIHQNLMCLINFVTSNYTCDDQQWYYIKISKWFKMLEAYKLNSWDIHSIKLQKSLYELK